VPIDSTNLRSFVSALVNAGLKFEKKYVIFMPFIYCVYFFFSLLFSAPQVKSFLSFSVEGPMNRDPAPDLF
jgi:hypothetical protein